MRFALIGQPNCGKSTLFNQVAGYKSETGNFSGTSVTFTESKVRVLGEVVEIVDLPGTYTLAGTNPAEREVLHYLASHNVDVIINVIDATHLEQGLDLTLELLELGRPMVVAMNVLDEAARMGLKVDGPGLEKLLGAPVLPLVASKGRGVRNLFSTASNVARQAISPTRPHYSLDVENAIRAVADCIDGQAAKAGIPLLAVPLAIKLLENDGELLGKLGKVYPEILPMVSDTQAGLQTVRGQPAVWVISGERHGLAHNLAEAVVQQGERRITWRDRLDDILLHPIFGYIALVLILLLFFEVVYGMGSRLEQPLLAFFDQLGKPIIAIFGAKTLVGELLTGLLQGVSGGVAIVLPYLLPFLLGLGFLEDIGYLPRVAFLMDALMHKLGLHGKAIVPFILGYGCNVPAVMSTRMLEDKRDRYLAAALAVLVPCAARLSVVFGLVAFYLGPVNALLIYLFNMFVIALTGRVLSQMMPEDTPGLIMEMPGYRMPTLRTVFNKAWFRVKEFVVEAWPVLIAGSAVLAILNYFAVTPYFNILIRPITWALGLPAQTGVPLIFGVLRKELSLVMLRQALGVTNFASALSPVQMVTFTVFVVFYIPCLATLAALRRELGTRSMFSIAGLTVVIALLAALFARVLATIFL
jgi:ferrous iron transport protein B